MIAATCEKCSVKGTDTNPVHTFLAVFKPGGRSSGKSRKHHFHETCAPPILRSLLP